jgi:hypothetical protein
MAETVTVTYSDVRDLQKALDGIAVPAGLVIAGVFTPPVTKDAHGNNVFTAIVTLDVPRS